MLAQMQGPLYLRIMYCVNPIQSVLNLKKNNVNKFHQNKNGQIYK